MKKIILLCLLFFSLKLFAFDIPAGTYYFDNSQTGWPNVYLFIGHGSYVISYQMTSTGNAPDVFSYNLGSQWSGATGFYFANNSGGVTSGSGSYNINTAISSLPSNQPTFKSITLGSAPTSGDAFVPYSTTSGFAMKEISSNSNLTGSSNVVSGNNVMFYINQSYGGSLGVTNNSSSTCISTIQNVQFNSNTDNFIEMLATNVPSTLSVTNNCGSWSGAGNFGSQTSTNAAGAKYVTGASNSKTNATTVTTSASSTSITQGTASITMTASHSGTTSSYGRNMYVQYYISGTYYASSAKLSGSSTTATINTSSLAAGTYTIQSVITDRIIYYKAADITLTVNSSSPTITSTSSSITSNNTQTYKGATITINGTNLSSINSVKIGGSSGVACTNVTVVNATQVTAVVPNGTQGGAIWVSDGTNNVTSSDSYTNLGFISTTTGNWTTGSTWLGGSAPSSTDKATIANSHTVTLDAASTIAQLTINSGGTYAGGSNTLTIAASGTLTNNGTFNAGTGTINFAGAATVNGSAAITFNNLTLNDATTMTTSPSVGGTLLVNNTNASILTNRVTYNSGSTLQFAVSKSIGSGDMFWKTNILSTGSAQKGVPWNVTVDASKALTFSDTYPYYMNGKMLINGSLSLGSDGSTHWGNLYLRGDLTNNGTFTHNSREVIFNGTSAQAINGTFNGTTTTNCFAYLTINNSAGVTLNTPVNVINTLTLTNGIVTTTATNILNITATGASAISGGGSSSFINGPLKRAFTSGTASDWIFPVGKGTTFLPCVINTPTGTSPITAEAFTSNCGGSSTGYALSTSEYWQLSGNTLTAGTVSFAKASNANTVVTYCSTVGGSYTSLGGTSTTVLSTTGVKAASTVNPLAPNYFVLATVTKPTTQATNLVFSNVTSSSMTLTWTNGNGSNRIVVAKQGSAPTGTPADGTACTANAAYGTSGTALGDGYVVYNGSSNTVSVTGLSPSTTYYYAVYEYNGSSTSCNYLTTSPATGNQTTLAVPTITVNPTTATFTAQVGATSSSQSFTITGAHLTTDITVTAPAYYQVSTDNSTWSASAGSVTFTQTAGSVSGTLYVRYVPTASESSVAKNVALTSTGATTKNIVVTGTAVTTTTITVQFQKPTSGWGSSVYLYTWNTTSLGAWPGVLMTYTGVDNWWTYTFTYTGSSVSIKFNQGNSSYQTVDITGVTSSTCYVTTGGGNGSMTVATSTSCPTLGGNNYYKSSGDVTWSSSSNWLVSTDGTNYGTASTAPSTVSVYQVIVQSGNTLSISSPATTPVSANFIVNGTLELKSGGSVSTAPTYGASSILKYNTLGDTNSGTEWTPKASSGAGYPANVIIQSGKLTLYAATTETDQNGTDLVEDNFFISGNLNVAASAKLYLDTRDGAKPWNSKGLNINGDIINNGTIEMSTDCHQAISCDNFTNTGQTILSSTAVGGDLYITGNFYNNGASASAVNINGRALIMTGNKDQIIGGSAAGTYEIDYFIVAKSNKTDGSKSMVTLQHDLLSDGEGNGLSGGGAVTVNGGILDMSGHTVQIARNSSTYFSTITTDANGAIRTNASSKLYVLGDESTKNTGTLRFDQTTPGTTNVIGVFRMNRSNSQAELDVANSFIVTDSLRIQQGLLKSTADIQLNSGAVGVLSSTSSTAKFTVNNLVFCKTSTNSAEFYKNGQTLTINGKVRAKVTFDQTAKWHFISFPCVVSNVYKSDGTTVAVLGTDYSLGEYDASKRAINVSGWKSSTDNPMTAGKGYIINKKNTLEDLYFDSNVTGSDAMFNSTASKSLTYTSSSVCDCDAGWNFIAHPLSASATPTLSGGEFAYSYNASSDTYKLWYYQYNSGYTYGSASLHPFDAFFVKTPNSATVTLSYTAYTNPVSNVKSLVTTSDDVITLNLNANNIQYETFVRILNDATGSYDVMYDAPYSVPMSGSTPRMYSLIGSDMYTLNSVPEVSQVPLGIRLPASGSYSFNWTISSSTLPVTLTDLVTGVVTDLSTVDSYNFTSDVSGDINDRFVLNVGKKVITVVPDNQAEGVMVYGGVKQIDVKGLSVGDNVLLYDVSGRLLHRSKSNKTSMVVPVSESGVYVLTIEGEHIKPIRSKVVVY